MIALTHNLLIFCNISSEHPLYIFLYWFMSVCLSFFCCHQTDIILGLSILTQTTLTLSNNSFCLVYMSFSLLLSIWLCISLAIYLLLLSSNWHHFWIWYIYHKICFFLTFNLSLINLGLCHLVQYSCMSVIVPNKLIPFWD